MMTTLGQRIRQRREELRLTRRALAQRLGMTEGAIVRWEGDKMIAPLPTLTRVAAALDVSLAWLVEPAEPKPKP